MTGWKKLLANACAAASITEVAARLDLPENTVRQVVRGGFKGDSRSIEAVVRGALAAETVKCPVIFDPLRLDACVRHQWDVDKPATDPIRQALRRACPACPNSLLQQADETDVVELLQRACARLGSWQKVANALGYSRTAVSLRVRNKYARDLTEIDRRIRQVFGAGRGGAQ